MHVDDRWAGWIAVLGMPKSAAVRQDVLLLARHYWVLPSIFRARSEESQQGLWLETGSPDLQMNPCSRRLSMEVAALR